MNIEHKAISLEDAEISDTGQVEGYASLFNVRDEGGDVVVPGAFRKTIDIRAGRPLAMLREHDPREVIGVWEEMAEDDRGLRVRGKLFETQRGRDALTEIKGRALDGLSIGYSTIDAEQNGRSRMLKELRLMEVSVVLFPMLRSAQIDAVKAGDLTDRQIEARLTQDAKFSRSVARALMRGGLTAVRTMQDAGDDNAAHRMLLKGILSEIRAVKEGQE